MVKKEESDVGDFNDGSSEDEAEDITQHQHQHNQVNGLNDNDESDDRDEDDESDQVAYSNMQCKIYIVLLDCLNDSMSHENTLNERWFWQI